MGILVERRLLQNLPYQLQLGKCVRKLRFLRWIAVIVNVIYFSGNEVVFGPPQPVSYVRTDLGIGTLLLYAVCDEKHRNVAEGWIDSISKNTPGFFTE